MRLGEFKVGTYVLYMATDDVWLSYVVSISENEVVHLKDFYSTYPFNRQMTLHHNKESYDEWEFIAVYDEFPKEFLI